MRIYLMIVACVFSLLTPNLAAAAPAAQSYDPSSPWNVDYADDSCALRRSFSYANRSLIFEARQFQPGDRLAVTVVSKQFSQDLPSPKIRFSPDSKPHEVKSSYSLQYPSGASGFVWNDSFMPIVMGVDGVGSINVTDEFRDAREFAIQGIELSGSLRPPILIATGEMHSPMKAMRKCMDELLTHWGLDAPTQRELTQTASPLDQRQWAKIIQAEYPSAMLNQMKGGIVRIRMIVGPNGKGQSCHIQVPSQDPSFEKSACNGMMKASQFRPALDAAGKPVTSYYTTSIIYIVN